MISELIQHLQANVAQLKFVGAAADFQTADSSNPKVTPACYVIPLGERPGPAQFADVLRQRVVATVGIVLVVRNLSDSQGAAAGIDMAALRSLVKAKVYGWQAADEFDPFERGDSSLLSFRDGHMWWLDSYVTAFYDGE